MANKFGSCAARDAFLGGENGVNMYPEEEESKKILWLLALEDELKGGC